MPISCQTCRDNLPRLLEPQPDAGDGVSAPVSPGDAPVSEPAAAASVSEAVAAPPHAELESHLANCADCARELALLRNITATLRDLPLQPAPADLRARIRTQLTQLQTAGSATTTTLPADGNHTAPPVPIVTSQTGRRIRPQWLDFFRQPARVAWTGGVALAAFMLVVAVARREPASLYAPPSSYSTDAARDERAQNPPPAQTASGTAAKAKPSQPPAVGSAARRSTAKALPAETAAATRPQRPPQLPANRNGTVAGAGSARQVEADPRHPSPPLRVAEPGAAPKPREAAPSSPAAGPAPLQKAQNDETSAAITESGERESRQQLRQFEVGPRANTQANARAQAQAQAQAQARVAIRAPAARVPALGKRRSAPAPAASPPSFFARLEMLPRDADARAMSLNFPPPSAAPPMGAPAGGTAGLGAIRPSAAGAGGAAPASASAAGAAMENTGNKTSQAHESGRGAPGGVPGAAGVPAPPAALAPSRGATRARGEAPAQPLAPASPVAQRKTQGAKQDAAQGAGGAVERALHAGAMATRAGGVRRARLRVVPTSDAARARVRVVLPPGWRFADASSMGSMSSAGRGAARIVWMGSARRGQATEIALSFIAPPGLATVRVALQELSASSGLQTSGLQRGARGDVWKTLNEQAVTITIR